MIKILISFLICFAASKHLIMIGDGRIQEMAQVLMNVGLKEYKYGAFKYKYLVTESPISYEGYDLDIIAVNKNTIKHLFDGGQPYISVHDKLKKATPGTSVILNLGIQNLDYYNDIFVFYGKLADKYRKLNFYVVSLIGLNDGDPKTNTVVKDFNKRVEKRIKIVGFKNLHYKDILNNNDPSQIIVNNELIHIFDYSTDSVGFFRNGYIRIFKAMVEGLGNILLLL